MGKSKYQVKAQVKINSGDKSINKKPRYYDENIKKQAGMSRSFFAFLIVLIIIGFGTGFGILIANNNAAVTPNDNGSTGILTEDPGIQRGDVCSLEYTLWTAEPNTGVSGFVNVSGTAYQGPATADFTIDPSALIYGFYINVLGHEVGDEFEFDLGANYDANQDGYDDYTGEVVMSYGSGEFANTNLHFRVRVFSITRP